MAFTNAYVLDEGIPMGKRQPAAPDPVATAQAQAGANRTTALTEQQINMIDQVNPWGSVRYRQTGQAFSPTTGIGSESYYYNPTTGEYRTSIPTPVNLTNGSSASFSDLPGVIRGISNGSLASSAQLDATMQADGWQRVQGILTPRYEQYTELSPEQQAIFDQTQAAETNLAGLAADQSAAIRDLLNTEFSFNNDDASQWAYDLASPRILEQQRQNELAARNTLASKGIREGSAAWDREMQRLTNANTDQLNQLALTGRQQAFSEALAQRNQPINEITALLSGSQVSNPAQMSGPTPQSSVGGVDYSGIVQQNYQNQINANNARMGGIGGLFGTILGGPVGGALAGRLF